MAGRIYSAHVSKSLSGGGGAAFAMYITAPATNAINLLQVQVGGDYDGTAGDDPVLARLVRITSPASGTAVTPSKHDTRNSLASGATVVGGSVTGSEVSNSEVWKTYVNPKDAYRPAVTIAPSETWAVELDPGDVDVTVVVSMIWEE
jgi:hypothetical protein